MTSDSGQSWGTVTISHVASSAANGGDEVFTIFGMPSRFSGLARGPAATAIWERAQDRARADGAATLDLDELVAAYRVDGVEV